MKPDDDTPEPKDHENDPPDGRGPRLTDPNELAKWIVEQTAQDENEMNSRAC